MRHVTLCQLRHSADAGTGSLVAASAAAAAAAAAAVY